MDGRATAGERGLWPVVWMLAVPVAVTLAPRLEPRTVELPRLEDALQVQVPAAAVVRAPPTFPVDPPTDVDVLGTFVWDGCLLHPADPRFDRDRPDLHVRTGYVPDTRLPELLSELDHRRIPGAHLGFYTAPRSLEPLARWADLRVLTFEGDHLDDDALAPLARLTDLRMLEMGVRPYEANRVTDAGLKHLAGLHELRYLGIHAFDGITGSGLRHLARLPNLRDLELSYTRVDDDALAYLSGLHTLVTLSLQHTRVTDAGLRHLASLPNLATLDLRQTAVTPASAAILAGFPALERVVLHHNLQFDVIEAVREQGIAADGFGWIRGTVGCEHWPGLDR